MKKLLSITIILFIIAAFSVVLLYQGYLRFNYPSVDRFPIRGIDVSHHQKDINWDKVGQETVHFAFIKATEGGDFKDKKFTENWDEAKRVGIDVGAYHFFTFCKGGTEQAQNFIESVPNETDALPPVIDLEYGGNCQLQKPKEAVLLEIDTLIQVLFAHYKKQPILYVTNEFYNDFLLGKYTNNPLWIRDVFDEPHLSNQRKWVFWQYGNRGHLKGVKTYVDLNVFYGSKADYEQFKISSR